jgi:hypothetical protein
MYLKLPKASSCREKRGGLNAELREYMLNPKILNLMINSI